MIILTSRMSVRTESIEAFIRIAEAVIKETRKEAGCLEYELFQDPLHPEKFMFYEIYADSDAQQFHSRQPYLEEFRRLREPMLQYSPVLKIYNATLQKLS